MTAQDPNTEAIHPDIVADSEPSGGDDPSISQPTKLIRMAAMTRAMLDEVRQAPTDEPGRRRLLEIHERSLNQLRDVISEGLRQELDDIFLPLGQSEEPPSESEIRIAQAQLVGWLEGLFHGIQASLFSQQMVAQNQLAEMRGPGALNPGETDPNDHMGTYL